MNQTMPTCTSSLIIFGGTGDLARRKLIPALLRLHSGGYLPSDLQLIIAGRKDLSREELIRMFRESLDGKAELAAHQEETLQVLEPRICYTRVDPADPQAAANLMKSLKKFEGEGGAPVRLFYLALPPEQVPSFLPLLAESLDRDSATHCPSRVLVEKPFGSDLSSARKLNEALLRIAREEQILRIDHYLGKEAVQNILVMRFANIFFEPVWNSHYIDHVQISFAETIGVGKRAAYFDQTGILRDVVQNHLLQVLSLIAMEPPISSSASNIRREKMKVLRALRPIQPDQTPELTIRGRYEKNAANIPGYLGEDDIPPDSMTETYAALKVHVDTWRWSGVPFYLRAGKRLSNNLTEINICFKNLPHRIFPASAGPVQANMLTLRVQPDEGVHLSVQTKSPGMSLQVAPVKLNFTYQESFGSYRPDAYERLLLDALHGDLSLFLSNEEIELAWQFIDPIIAGWDRDRPQASPLTGYEAGSDGPVSATRLIEADGRVWQPLFSKGQ